MAKSQSSKAAIAQVHELLYQALETERGGIKVYQNAIACAQNADFRKELKHYLEETRRHEQILLGVFEQLGLDPELQTAGRKVVAFHGESLVAAMQLAAQGGDPRLAEIAAGECVVLAETKDHQNWELIGMVAKHLDPRERELLQNAYEQVEDEEDHHLYHSTGWTRELWLDCLGLPAELPPPEEAQKVSSKRGAARVEEARHKAV